MAGEGEGASGKLLEEIADQQVLTGPCTPSRPQTAAEEDPVEALLLRLLSLIDLDREVAGEEEWSRLYSRLEQLATAEGDTVLVVAREGARVVEEGWAEAPPRVQVVRRRQGALRLVPLAEEASQVPCLAQSFTPMVLRAHALNKVLYTALVLTGV